MDRLPTKEDLDKLPTRRPIVVVDLSGHTAVVNSRALEIAGITGSTPNPQGGGSSAAAGSPPESSRTRDRARHVEDPAAHRPRRTRTRWQPPTRRWRSRGSPPTWTPRWAPPSWPPWPRSRTGAAHDPAVRGDHRVPGLARRSRAHVLAHRVAERELRARRAYNPNGEDVLRRSNRASDSDGGAAAPVPRQPGTKRNPRWVPGKNRGPTYFRQAVANRAIDRARRRGLAGPCACDRRSRGALGAGRTSSSRAAAGAPATVTRSRISS